ncbi:DUF899 family protein [Sutcliffiella rhizosphaerae]|uniref:Glyoxalase/fosfomycin resistance/dioxygenase domain-containing protein n=1 Tax=Sutcliffiella rhizosphaerae TaxID=2880967 RepID=A0ABN8A8Z7_9BACI|nr:DUF899 family protein [Sutcliffiella rhizosphaerae]CAG9621631.1 hypothetical protein BACCIP111883_02404 [Sutcliffiella rhizosphaerae]
MIDQELLREIQNLEKEIVERKQRLASLRKNVEPQLVCNYVFSSKTWGKVSLIELFEDKDELIIVHNMGRSCSYCTMWADGLNGLYHHIKRKAAFVVSTPDAVIEQENIAAERGWSFPMISTKETTFKEDMGFAKDNHSYPGVTVFSKDIEGNIYKHSSSPFGPGDDFCPVWPLFDLLPSGYDDYRPDKKINDRSQYQLTNNIALQVREYEKAIHFYHRIFGMKPIKSTESETHFSLNNTNIYIEDKEYKSGTLFLEFAVVDINKAIQELNNFDCNIIKKYNDKSYMIRDPFGLSFHLFEV